MPIPHLFNIEYTQLDPMTWCAVADVGAPLHLSLRNKPPLSLVSNTLRAHPINFTDFNWQYYTAETYLSARKNALNHRQQQRLGVRLLLQELLTKLEIEDALDETQYPYRLINSKYYVCFSHSSDSYANNKVAVIISRQRTVGIDIETNKVDWHVAQRFYHSNEIALLQTLPTTQRETTAKLLWQIKESFIKIHHYKLAQGLGMNYEHLIPNIVINFEQNNSLLTIIEDNESGYQITLLLSHQTVVIF
ncbi:4'-phosphopantetheinyl transferase superfamily protein [Psychrobacter sp. P11G5]|uniref:4'-phosphopantetheinyl transferase family protein n=1 Tax=Psychrobacter sp. P11G5 TaxID=1699624 RepID=UPI00078DD6B4|nr:4'-phosphopantetheinyl transferase superfamily protein [Psychrobacter sp. P11G5]AMN67290.1 hypothetical protein AK825_05855 [Psychrobacter sp. P11G5]